MGMPVSIGSMKILVYPTDLIIGGSQINAIDLAARTAAAGHEVMIYGRPGPLVDYIRAKGLRYIEAHNLRYRPAPQRIAQLLDLARRESIDLIHAYEWPSCLDAYLGAGIVRKVPILCTVLSMHVSPFVPASVPLVMGTADLADEAGASHRGPVWTLEPPIDAEQDSPAIDGSAFRARLNLQPGEQLVVSVSRLALDLKLDALVRAIDAVDLLADRYPLRLALVGGGQAEAALASRARQVNERHGREVVTLAGEEFDPRPAYAAADIVVGMGSSSLRAMSMAKPVVVQGEDGFSEIFSPDTLPLFMRQGFYGLGQREPGAQRLAGQLATLLDDAALRTRLGAYGRSSIENHFSLDQASLRLQAIYSEVVAAPPAHRWGETLQVCWRALLQEIHNHEPARKRRQRQREQTLLSAAALGNWPPDMARL